MTGCTGRAGSPRTHAAAKRSTKRIAAGPAAQAAWASSNAGQVDAGDDQISLVEAVQHLGERCVGDAGFDRDRLEHCLSFTPGGVVFVEHVDRPGRDALGPRAGAGASRATALAEASSHSSTELF